MTRTVPVIISNAKANNNTTQKQIENPFSFLYWTIIIIAFTSYKLISIIYPGNNSLLLQ